MLQIYAESMIVATRLEPIGRARPSSPEVRQGKVAAKPRPSLWTRWLRR